MLSFVTLQVTADVEDFTLVSVYIQRCKDVCTVFFVVVVVVFALIQVDKSPTRVGLTSKTRSNYRRRSAAAGLDELSVTFDLGGGQQNQLATLAADQTEICAREKKKKKRGLSVQLREFMDGLRDGRAAMR